MRRKLIVAALVLLVAAAAGGWFAYKPLLARHLVGRLAAGDESAVERVAALGAPAVPRLLELLKQDAPAAPLSGQALTRMSESWPNGDPRRAEVAGQVADSFAGFTAPGQQSALRLAEALAATSKDAAGRIVLAALKDGLPAAREQAIVLALRPDVGQGAAVVPLLQDPEASVRRCALEAVGPDRDLAPDEELLPLLHDADADVRGLCEAALKGRGLRDKDVRLGRLLTDPAPLKRLEVIRLLPADDEIDPQAWLARLCQDPSPAVRAGAARAAAEHDMADQLRRMAQSDPDGTVRQIAEFLVRQRSAER